MHTQCDIPNLDIHITHRCNFSCDSCSHFSNHKFTDEIKFNDFKNWIDLWKNKVNPAKIGILGGEPFLNPRVAEYCEYARKSFPNSRIELVTNAFVLKDISDTLIKNNIILAVSVHHNNPEYKKTLAKQKKIIDSWGVKVEYWNSFLEWKKVYKGYGENIEPYEDNDPEGSWNHCPTGQNCFQLHEGKMWKCAPLAFLPMMNEKYKLSEKWNRYLEYVPLSPDCTTEELQNFINRGAESFCSMCPSNSDYFVKDMPYGK